MFSCLSNKKRRLITVSKGKRKEFLTPITWIGKTIATIKANSVEEAIELVQNRGTIALPENPYGLENTIRIDWDNPYFSYNKIKRGIK